MNCNLCKQELEAYFEGRLPEGIRVMVESHICSCKDCAAIYQQEVLTYMVIDEEKQVQSNPFLITRIMSEIAELEHATRNNEHIPVYSKVLRPVLVSISLAAAIIIGILAGNMYQPVRLSVPVEMTYVNDAAIESVYVLANN